MNDFPVTTERFGSSNAGVFLGAGQPMDLRTFPLPSPESGEAIVRIECCTLCGSDLHTITGKRTENCPSILGHEILGIVDTVGDPPPCDLDGRPLRAGDRITWSTSVSCGDCDRCRGGLPQKCRTLAKYGHELAEGRYALSGGLSQFCSCAVVRQRFAFRVISPRKSFVPLIVRRPQLHQRFEPRERCKVAGF